MKDEERMERRRRREISEGSTAAEIGRTAQANSYIHTYMYVLVYVYIHVLIL